MPKAFGDNRFGSVEVTAGGVGYQRVRAIKEPPKLRLGHWYRIAPDTDTETLGRCMDNLPGGRATMRLRWGATVIVQRTAVLPV